jgi:hypothetical protein
MAGGWQAQRAVDELGDITALDALRANAELVQLLLGRRWYVMQDAREAGATWDEIGEARHEPARRLRLV